MAKIENLKESVKKAQEKVEKCKKTIERHEKQLAKKQNVLIKMGYDISDLEAIKWNTEKGGGSEVYWEVCDVEGKQRDIEGANKKLREAERVLANWQEKLDKETEKERFLEGNAPQVIKDFLETWKQNAFDWHVKRYNDYLALLDKLEKQAKALRKELGIRDGFYTTKEQREVLEEKKLDSDSIERRVASFAGHTVIQMSYIRNEAERLEWLDKMLEEDKKAKMLDLINRVNAIVGTITDASYLEVSPQGNLDGYIEGEKGRAKVQTIGAGGYNIQCFHFRVLVNKY